MTTDANASQGVVDDPAQRHPITGRVA
eukprot:COSAG06_NODE_57941_length_278_cov_1.446927_1_plen_26_part_10